jgi:hypothetical protein
MLSVFLYKQTEGKMMSAVVPTHLSNKLEFSYKNRSFWLVDRANFKLLLPGIVFGILLFLLGFYELCHAFENGGEELVPTEDVQIYHPLLAVWFFDLCFMAVGLGMALTNIFLYLRYNKYRFWGKKVTLIKRPFWHDKITIQEDLKNYTGVRFRVEFLQSGFLTQNRYIIELYHPNAAKIVPLYISTSSKGVRRKMKEYAKAFKLPVVMDTDEGMRFVDYKDLNKSVAALYRKGIIEDKYDAYETLPQHIRYVRKRDKIVLKVRKVVWDVYNIMAWIAIFLVGVIIAIVLLNLDTFKNVFASTLYSMSLLGIGIIIIAIQILFRKEKLVVKKHKIVNTYKYMLFSTKHNEILKKDIEDVEVTMNPATGRYFVSIISEDNTITFGAKMAIKDLQWIKRFVIHEIIN